MSDPIRNGKAAAFLHNGAVTLVVVVGAETHRVMLDHTDAAGLISDLGESLRIVLAPTVAQVPRKTAP